MKRAAVCILLLAAASLALAAETPATKLPAASRRLLAKDMLPGLGKGQTKVEKHESTEYVEVTEYKDTVVTEQEVKYVPKLTTETISIKRPKVVMETEVVQIPKTLYRSEIKTETKAINRPMLTMEPRVMATPRLSMTIGKGKGFTPKVDAHVEEGQKVFLAPKFTTRTDMIQVNHTVAVPYTVMENVTISRPKVVMEEEFISKPRVVMDKIVVEKQVTKQKPVKVTRPVKKVTYAQVPTAAQGKGSSFDVSAFFSGVSLPSHPVDSILSRVASSGKGSSSASTRRAAVPAVAPATAAPAAAAPAASAAATATAPAADAAATVSPAADSADDAATA